MIANRTRFIVSFLLLLIFFGVIVAPLILLFASTVWVDGRLDLSAYSNVLQSPRQWTLLFRSVGLASGVALFATILGASAAYALMRMPRAIHLSATFALTLPVIVPQHIMAIAWVDVLGRSGYLSRFVQIAMPGAPPAPSPFTFWGTLFILAMTLYPIPMLATFVALRRFDARFIEAARVTGQSRGAFRAIVLPLTMPSILTGSLVVFALSVSTFAVPSLLQVNTYPVEIHASSMSFDYGSAAAQSIPLLAVCAATFAIWNFYVRPRHAWLSGAARGAPDELPGEKPAARVHAVLLSLFLLLVGIGALVVPFAALFVRSLPLRTYASVWGTAREEIVTGLIVAACAATVISAIAFSMGAIVQGTGARAFVRYASLFAFVAPGPLLALGMIAQWNRPGIAGIVYDSAAILILASVARFFAFGNFAFEAHRARMNPRLFEAARVAGVPWWRSIGAISLPLALPYLVAVWVVTFVLALGEVDAAVLLSPPGVSTFALRLFSLMHYGPNSFVAALSLIAVFCIALLATAGAVGFKILSRRFNAGA